GHKVTGALAFPFTAREARRIHKGALALAAVQQSFLEKPVERSHHRGVSERTAQMSGDLVDVTFTPRPERFQDVDFEWPQGPGCTHGRVTAPSDAEETSAQYLAMTP